MTGEFGSRIDNAAPSGAACSAGLARFLRNGAARPMIDRLVRAAANASCVDYMVLGIRYGDFYEFISTHGVSLTGYRDRVSGSALDARLFAREIEVEDLQVERSFTVLSIVEPARHWRYGVNVPVRLIHPLADGGVLALSGAHDGKRPLAGNALEEMRRIADIIGDSIWLMQQVQAASEQRDTAKLIGDILANGVSNSPSVAAITNSELDVIGFSSGFAEHQLHKLSIPALKGSNLAGLWLDPHALQLAADSLQSIKPIIGGQTLPEGLAEPVSFEFYPIMFDAVPRRFAFFTFSKSELAHFGDPNSAPVRTKRALLDGDGTLATSQFLLETLVKKRRLLKRKAQSYVGLRTWSKPVKKFQVTALKALKLECPDSFVHQVVDEMADEIRALLGSSMGYVVVPVPCGHSGPDCFSTRLAEKVARKLGLVCIQAFACQPQHGKSHPKTNIHRSKMRLENPVASPVILIDDVATSGAHIEEASRLLLQVAPSVLAMCWIAD